MDIGNSPFAPFSASVLGVAMALGSSAAVAQTQDRVDRQQIETVPAGLSDVTAAPDANAESPATEGTTEAGAEVDQTVQAAERDAETGLVEAAEAGGTPTENWFGCKPSAEGKMDQCEEGAGQKGAGQTAAASETGGSASQ